MVMRRYPRSFLLIIMALIVGSPFARAVAAAGSADEVVDVEAAELFRAAEVDGAFVLLDLDSGKTVIVGPRYADESHRPYSTFKLPNTLIGLETGVISGEDFTLHWNGVKHPERPAWDHDHNLASALRESVVWYYQEVARRIGRKRMDDWVANLNYGNGKIGTAVDRFWLDGPLLVSPRQQVDFLRRLRMRDLPVANRHAELLEKLMIREQGDGWVLRGKTGLGQEGKRRVGWLVGLIDAKGKSYAYATLILGHADRFAELRLELTRALLLRFGLLPS